MYGNSLVLKQDHTEYITLPVCVFVFVHVLVKYLAALSSAMGIGRTQNKDSSAEVIKDRKSRRKERRNERELKEIDEMKEGGRDRQTEIAEGPVT